MKRSGLVWLVALLAAAPGRGQTPEQKKATLDYLIRLQTREGGFRPDAAAKQPGLRATTAALRAIKYFGGTTPNAGACARFVGSCFDCDTGGLTDRPGGEKPDVFSTAVGVMAVAELKMPAKKFAGPATEYLGKNARDFEDVRIAAAGLEAIKTRPPQADEWLKKLAARRNKDGTYGAGDGKARDTGGAVVAVLRLGGKVEARAAVLAALKAGQRADGGFGKVGAKGSDLETTYRVLRAFHMLGDRPDAAKLRGFLAKCRNADGGYGVAPGQKSSAGSTYFAGVILHWLGEK